MSTPEKPSPNSEKSGRQRARKLTFKRHPRETGLASIANQHPWVDIKLNKKVIGQIKPPSAFSAHKGFKVMLKIIDPKSNCGWNWVTLKHEGESEAATRSFLQERAESLLSRYAIYVPEEDED